MSGPGAYWIGDEEISAVLRVLQSRSLSRYGSLNDPLFNHQVFDLEKNFAQMIGVKYAVATNSGTSALLTSLLAMGLRPGDEVIIPAYTFVASYSACIFAGIIPILAEIDDSLTIDPEDIARHVTPRTKAIMPVHMLGNPCDMDKIMSVAERHGLLVIEDCCQAAGALYKGRRVGSFGDMACFSFNIFKTVTAGDGGMIVTNNDVYYENAFGIHDQGHKPNRAETEMGTRNILGLNFRMNELTGAVALAQLRKIDRITETLREKKKRFKDLIENEADFRFRKINDVQGECATLCTLLFPTAERASHVAKLLGTKPVSASGWHVYSNMEHVLNHLGGIGHPVVRNSLPRTDDLLSRSINMSVGVVDDGLGSGWGININSTEGDIRTCAETLLRAVRK